jgi:sterol desaturase/sphingolipid hydroxylase (fatty acid hydroxylase superfamily)
MSRKKGNKVVYERKPWITMRSGIISITVLSFLMAGLTIWQLLPAAGWGVSLLYGLLYGGLIWVIFLGMQFFYRWLHPVKRD